jgi:ribosome-associated heat shock protein Hsp15
MRLDKWLWAARFYKTRGLARAAIEGGKVRIDGARVKPAREIALGNRIEIGAGDSTLEVAVVKLGERRGPAPEARQLYDETPESQARREQAVVRTRVSPEPTSRLRGRPTKKDRRALDRFRGSQ